MDIKHAAEIFLKKRAESEESKRIINNIANWDETLSLKKLGQKFGMSPTGALNMAQTYGLKYSASEVEIDRNVHETIKYLSEKHYTFSAISRLTGVSPHYCRKYAEMELQKKKYGPKSYIMSEEHKRKISEGRLRLGAERLSEIAAMAREAKKRKRESYNASIPAMA